MRDDLICIKIESSLLGANCYIVGEPGGDAVVIDAGLGVTGRVMAALAAHGLVARGILCSHGHLDHVADAPRLERELGVPVGIGRGDAYRLRDPLADLPADWRPQLVAALGDEGWHEPESVIGIDAGKVPAELTGGLDLDAFAAAGHTEGATLYETDKPVAGVGQAWLPSGPRALFTGDVLFAGSIGRVDLPGGDELAMRSTIRNVLLPLPDDTVVLPGHGPATTIRGERSGNPFLAGAAG